MAMAQIPAGVDNRGINTFFPFLSTKQNHIHTAHSGERPNRIFLEPAPDLPFCGIGVSKRFSHHPGFNSNSGSVGSTALAPFDSGLIAPDFGKEKLFR